MDDLDRSFQNAIEIATYLMETTPTPRERIISLLQDQMYQACIGGKVLWAIRIQLVVERLQGVTREDQMAEALEWLNAHQYMAAA